MKKYLSVSLTALALTGLLAVPALAAGPTGVYQITVDDAALQTTGCIMVPLRSMAESLGFTVTWTGSSALVDNGVLHTEVTPGVDRYTVTTSNPELVGMSAPFSFGVPPYAADGVTYVPLGLFDSLLGSREGAFTLTDDTIRIQTRPDDTRISNPFLSCSSLEEARSAAGFSITLPEGSYTFQVLPGSLLQASGEGLTIRKGTGGADVSGDYTAYPRTGTLTAGGNQVTWRGTDDQIMVAVWTADGYTFSVSSDDGLTPEELTSLAAAIG